MRKIIDLFEISVSMLNYHERRKSTKILELKTFCNLKIQGKPIGLFMKIMNQFTELYKGRFFLLLFLFSLVFALACGGGDEESTEETVAEPSAEYLAALAKMKSGNSGTPLAGTESVIPVATKQPIVISGDSEAKLVLWDHLVTCRHMTTDSISSHHVENDSGDKEFSLYPSLTSKNEFGVWKINEREGVLVPQNSIAQSWDEWAKSGLDNTVDKKCNSVLEKYIPTEVEDPVVKVESDARVVVWTFLSKCYPDLQVALLTSYANAAEGGFVVKSSANSKTDHGLWNVKADGTINSMNAKAQERDSEITSGQCKNLIRSQTEAISAVWAYIVNCNPLLSINDLGSNWDPKEEDWVVITTKVAQTRTLNPEPDHGIWRVTRDAQITAINITAQTEKIRAEQGTEKC
jgi:hypothetical protein